MEEFFPAAHNALEHEKLLRTLDALPTANGDNVPILVNPGILVPLNGKVN